MATATTSSATLTQDLQALFDLIPLPAWVFDDVTLRFVCVNEAAVARYGFSRDEFLRMTIADIRPPAERPIFLEEFARTRNDPFPRCRWRHQTSGGEVFEVEVSARALVLEGRKAHFVIATDMSEHLRLQEALFHSRRRLQALFDNALDAILLANDAGELGNGRSNELDVAERERAHREIELAVFDRERVQIAFVEASVRNVSAREFQHLR